MMEIVILQIIVPIRVNGLHVGMVLFIEMNHAMMGIFLHGMDVMKHVLFPKDIRA